jgi:hypothetical protein
MAQSRFEFAIPLLARPDATEAVVFHIHIPAVMAVAAVAVVVVVVHIHVEVRDHDGNDEVVVVVVGVVEEGDDLGRTRIHTLSSLEAER